MLIFKKIALEFDKTLECVKNIVDMLDSGDTVPFISRYRKEQAGNIDSETLYELQDRLNYLRNLEKRKQTIKNQMREREQLTPELEKQIDSYEIASQLEEFYEPFIPREDSPGTKAIEKGLKPLAELIANKGTKDNEIEKMISKIIEEKNYSREEIIEGAKDIIYEDIIYDPQIKEKVRNISKNKAILTTKKINKKNKEEQVDTYDKYKDTREDIHKIPSHRVLAMFRGTKEKQLNMNLVVDEERIKNELVKHYNIGRSSRITQQIYEELSQDAYINSIKGLIESEIKKEVFEKAEDHAVEVFCTNLKNLLMQKPVKDKIILGWDPGYATGCKLAVIDKTGNLLGKNIVKVTPPYNQIDKGKEILHDLVKKYKVEVISIGNGTASKESEIFVVDFIKENPQYNLKYVVVSEAGASVYSASAEAKREFPDLDIYYRSAINIARRLQDPLSELVKINPRSLGIGQYQHDINAKKLKQALDRVITTCVNTVGVDINTASISLLQYVSGLNSRTATNIVEYRDEVGFIKNRKEVRNIKGIGDKTYQQCIGFLRIFGGDEELDQYFIHPENYSIAKELQKLI